MTQSSAFYPTCPVLHKKRLGWVCGLFFLVSFGFLATAHAAVIADLAGDYASAKAGFTAGQQAVLTGTNGTWKFSNVNGGTATPMVFKIGIGDTSNKGFKHPTTDADYGTPIISDEQIFQTDSGANINPPITTEVGKLNFHPRNGAANSTDVNWTSSYTGPVTVTGFIQHAKTSGTGINYALTTTEAVAKNGGANPVTVLANGVVRSSGVEFAPQTLIIANGTQFDVTTSAANGDYGNGTSYLGLKVEAIPFITSFAASYDPAGIKGGWSYWSANNRNLAEATNKVALTFSGNKYTNGNDSGISPNKVHSNSLNRDSSQLEIHPEAPGTGRDFMIASWDVTQYDGNWFDIMGNVGSEVRHNNDFEWNGVQFSILADGNVVYQYDPIQITSTDGTGTRGILPEMDFFVDDVYAAETIQLVVNSLSHHNGDSTLLAAFIMEGTDPNSVPEPATWALLLCGFGFLVWWRKRK